MPVAFGIGHHPREHRKPRKLPASQPAAGGQDLRRRLGRKESDNLLTRLVEGLKDREAHQGSLDCPALLVAKARQARLALELNSSQQHLLTVRGSKMRE